MTIPRRDGEALALIVWEDWAWFLYLDTRQPYRGSDTIGHIIRCILYFLLVENFHLHRQLNGKQEAHAKTSKKKDMTRKEQVLQIWPCYCYLRSCTRIMPQSLQTLTMRKRRTTYSKDTTRILSHKNTSLFYPLSQLMTPGRTVP
jgi:hypothetical protein